MREHKYFLGGVDYNGSGRKNCAAYITWNLENGEFSMCAEIWDPRKTDIYCGGQCVDEVAGMFPHDVKAQRMLAIWKRWHLNKMKAGSPAQEQFLREHPVKAVYPESHYTKASQALAEAGLNPDPSFRNGYKYGSEWVHEELPADVIAEIQSWSTPATAAA